MSSLFCRHNRFTAECPICSKGTVLSGETSERSKPAAPRPTRSKPAKPTTATRYPHVSVGPVEHEARFYEVRLEQVPGGLRLGQWKNGELERKAPVLPISALRELFDEARGRGYVKFDLAEAAGDTPSVSEGRAGDFKEELRLEPLGEGFARIARWVFFPGTGVGWELQDSPVMLPEKRYREILGGA
jgi:hypothetical protein